MKGRASSYVWWPGIDKVLEDRVKSCSKCQQQQKLPASSTLHPWDWPDRPWVRLHADYAGPIDGKMVLVVVDAHSKWVEAFVVSSGTSSATIERLRSVFARFGLPEILVTDNGSAFTSAEFETFMKRNGIRHLRSAPYHPATNGLAERTVQTLKSALKNAGEGSLETKLSRILFNYRLTPHSTTGVSPAELLLGRRPRSHLDQIRPDIASRVQRNVDRQKEVHDRRARDRTFSVGDPVLLRNFANGPVWLTGIVHCVRGPLTYDVQLANGRVMRRHIEHLRHRVGSADSADGNDADDYLDLPLPEESGRPGASPLITPVPLRRSARPRHPPDRFEPLTY